MTERNDSYVVVAGPGTSLTIPGIIVSEIVMALSATSPVRRIEVDLGTHPLVGLHRAPSLAAAHGLAQQLSAPRHRAPQGAKSRRQAFRQWISPDAKMAIAFAWPGIDNEWIRDYVRIAKSLRVPTVVLCASLPPSRQARAVSIAGALRQADRVVVGNGDEARELKSVFGAYGPEVQTHRALSLTGRSRRSGPQQLTAFLPRESDQTLRTLLAAFDAIPEAQVSDFNLQVVLRYNRDAAQSIISNSYHSRHVELIGERMTYGDLRSLCDATSAVCMADPHLNSRAFSAAVDCGIVTVVMAGSKTPAVGRSYVGGLIADGRKPASIHVAMTHALRLDELNFPSPGAWRRLAERVVGSREGVEQAPTPRFARYAPVPQPAASPELVPLLQSATESG